MLRVRSFGAAAERMRRARSQRRKRTQGLAPSGLNPNRVGYTPIDLSRLEVTTLEDRPSKVRASDGGRTVAVDASFRAWFDALPNILAGEGLRELVRRTARAIAAGRPVLLGMGGHVIKVGLGPMVCDLLRDGLIGAVASNGSVTIHDVELALVGKTSEDVDLSLRDGSFGMSGETASFILSAIAAAPELGVGRALGDALLAAKAPFADASVLATCAAVRAPLCVSVAIGTDIVHAHPQADGAALGEAALVDFRMLCSVVADLLDGGVYLNFGSAVLLPEAFLKAVSVARNLGYRGDFTTADFDFIRQYRSQTNVVRRPHLGTAGRGFSFTGHHELLFPLFWQAVRTELA
jgi:hypothetical protein